MFKCYSSRKRCHLCLRQCNFKAEKTKWGDQQIHDWKWQELYTDRLYCIWDIIKNVYIKTWTFLTYQKNCWRNQNLISVQTSTNFHYYSLTTTDFRERGWFYYYYLLLLTLFTVENNSSYYTKNSVSSVLWYVKNVPQR